VYNTKGHTIKRRTIPKEGLKITNKSNVTLFDSTWTAGVNNMDEDNDNKKDNEDKEDQQQDDCDKMNSIFFGIICDLEQRKENNEYDNANNYEHFSKRKKL
jgi:hypothetical protein